MVRPNLHDPGAVLGNPQGQALRAALARFFETGAMTMTDVVPTYSPSMDIQISSNFDRACARRMSRIRPGRRNGHQREPRN